ncbi:MAG: hypothetical protein M5U31_10880 [Acidimicrobiia bacterium]|nr:hypothetical protein [Acidimicrobiia bacterium]
MRLLAAVAVGTCCFLVAAQLTGNPVRWRLRRSRERAAVSSRQLWLRQAGAGVSVRQFVVGSASAGVVAFVAVTALTGTWTVAVAPAVAVALLPRAYFARRRLQRLGEVRGAWPDGLRDILASISSGRSLSQALSSMAVSGPEPLRSSFARFPAWSRMLGTVPALELIKEELADPTSDRVIEVLILAHERGGQIVRLILEDLVAATTRDLKAAEEIRSEGLEMKINARAVVVLPWLVLVMLTLRPGAFRDFYGSSAGVLVVIVGAFMSVAGAWLIGRLGRDQGERRVFGASAQQAVEMTS